MVQTITRVVSQDGKTMTNMVEGTNAQGQTVNTSLSGESNRTGEHVTA